MKAHTRQAERKAGVVLSLGAPWPRAMTAGGRYRVVGAATHGERCAVAMEAVHRAALREELGYGAYLTAHTGGRLVSLRMPGSRDDRLPGGKRGKVTTFSAASRLRMFKLIHTVRRSSALPVFITLTFPDFFPTWEDAKRKMDTLFKRWKRRWPGVSALWRLEAKARKSGAMAGHVAPHFHMLVWGADFDGEKARLDWFEICGNSEYAHWRHGYDDSGVMLRSWEEAAAYCAAYCAKKGNASAPGRQWGVHNRGSLPVDRKPVVVRVTIGEAFKMRRLLRHAVERKIQRRARAAQSLYTPEPESLLKYLALLRGIKTRDVPQQQTRVQHWRALLKTCR